jgi:hypothetical protein
MSERFGPPEPAYPWSAGGGPFPTWRWGRLWSNRECEGVEWSFGIPDPVVLHLTVAKGGGEGDSLMFRISVWRLFSFFARVHLPWTPDPFEFVFFTNPWIFHLGRPRA